MGVLERWDRHNQGWAAASIRDPERRTGVRAIAVVGGLWTVATAVAVVLGQWLAAGVAAVKAQVFLLVSLFVWRQARRRRSGAHPVQGPSVGEQENVRERDSHRIVRVERSTPSSDAANPRAREDHDTG